VSERVRKVLKVRASEVREETEEAVRRIVSKDRSKEEIMN
jgi:hypothetical protein